MIAEEIFVLKYAPLTHLTRLLKRKQLLTCVFMLAMILTPGLTCIRTFTFKQVQVTTGDAEWVKANVRQVSLSLDSFNEPTDSIDKTEHTAYFMQDIGIVPLWASEGSGVYLQLVIVNQSAATVKVNPESFTWITKEESATASFVPWHFQTGTMSLDSLIRVGSSEQAIAFPLEIPAGASALIAGNLTVPDSVRIKHATLRFDLKKEDETSIAWKFSLK